MFLVSWGLFPSQLLAAESSSFWPSQIGTWSQLVQALLALLNILIVGFIFFRTRSDKAREIRLGVDSFWLQKVIVEPHTKKVEDLHAGLVDLLRKAEKSAQSLREAGAAHAEGDMAVSSYADLTSNQIEGFRFSILPLLRVVVDPQAGKSAKSPSLEIDNVIDEMEETATACIDELFQKPDVTISRAIDQIAVYRSRLLKALFNLHLVPFAKRK